MPLVDERRFTFDGEKEQQPPVAVDSLQLNTPLNPGTPNTMLSTNRLAQPVKASYSRDQQCTEYKCIIEQLKSIRKSDEIEELKKKLEARTLELEATEKDIETKKEEYERQLKEEDEQIEELKHVVEGLKNQNEEIQEDTGKVIV